MADYTQRTQDKILDFINKAQNKVAVLSNNLARSLDEVDQNPELVEIPIGLLDFIESLLSPHLDWEEAYVIDLIDFWIDKAELSHIAYLALSNYQMPRVTFETNYGITQAQLDAVNAASINRDGVIQIEVDANTAAILALGTILPVDFNALYSGDGQNVWNDDSRLHNHPNEVQLDSIGAGDIVNIDKLSDHFSNNLPGELHISSGDRISWDGRLQGITATGASIQIDLTDPLNPILSYTQQSIAIADVNLLQATLTSLQDQINGIPAGATGATPVITIGTVISGPTETPDVVISGTPEDPVLDFTLKDGVDGIDGSDFIIDVRGDSFNRLDASFDLKTFEVGDVAIGSEEITLTGHGYYDNMRIQLSGSDLPLPLNDYDFYYVGVVDVNTITLTSDKSGVPIDITDVGTGTHSIFPIQDFAFLGQDNGFIYFRLSPATYPDATSTFAWTSGTQIVGEDGWTPLYGLYTSGVNTKVIQLIDWIGGSGNKPTPDPTLGIPYYLGTGGWTPVVGDAVNIYGPAGPVGPQGDVFFPDTENLIANIGLYDSELKDFVFLASDTGFAYKKDSDTPGDWSTGYKWKGDDGAGVISSLLDKNLSPGVEEKLDIVWDDGAVTPIPPNTGINQFVLGSGSLFSNLVTQENVATSVAIQRTVGSPLTAFTGSECTDPRWNATMSLDGDYKNDSVTYTISGLLSEEVVNLNIFGSTSGGGNMAYWIQGVKQAEFSCGGNTTSQLYSGIVADGSGEITIEMTVIAGGVASINCLGIDRPQVTSGNESATIVTLSNTATGYVGVYVNGVLTNLAGDKTGDCYFSADAGVTAKVLGAAIATDILYWNGVIAGYELAVTDRIDLLYN
jgi:hypothetical protein